MPEQLKIKQEFLDEREKLFNNESLVKDSFKFCVRYSLLVEEYILKILKGVKLKGSLASVGSFSRRELSPFSDIDVMFIFEKVKGNEEAIQECVTKLWDGGIEVSHTVREFSDLKRFLKKIFTHSHNFLKHVLFTAMIKLTPAGQKKFSQFFRRKTK